jgi:hypothetical protein
MNLSGVTDSGSSITGNYSSDGRYQSGRQDVINKARTFCDTGALPSNQ